MNPARFINSPIIRWMKIVELDFYQDERGYNFEGYNAKDYWEGQQNHFAVDSFSYSRKGTLRGFHGDHSNWKLIQCLYGSIFFAVIDVRPESSSRDAVFTKILDASIPQQVLIPPGCVNAHQCISDECIFSYKLSEGYVPQNKQIHIKWNDPKYNIQWPIPHPVLSERDK